MQGRNGVSRIEAFGIQPGPFSLSVVLAASGHKIRFDGARHESGSYTVRLTGAEQHIADCTQVIHIKPLQRRASTMPR